MANNPLRRRLERAADAADSLPPAATPQAPPAADETGVLAREMAGAFGQLVASYREHFRLTPEEARRQATATTQEQVRRILDGPPDQVSWSDLDLLAARDPPQALRHWEAIKAAARQELRTGHRAARALESGDFPVCWERARFLALRAELSEAWRPRDALEAQLIDQLAQWQTLLWRWQETANAVTMLAACGRTRGRGANAVSEPPRLSDAETLEQAVRMVERLHGLYLRTLKALQERRRPAVLVRNARQVNLANQRINLGGR